MSNIIIFPLYAVEDPEDEYDPNDPGVDMSGYLAEFNRQCPDYDRRMSNADSLPFS